ncbi:MAG: sulfate adenylyltransferase [Gammaproteobacteria bacterium]|nr:sulfate adenylyltransferase [Gammaproteobacteria bacterium]
MIRACGAPELRPRIVTDERIRAVLLAEAEHLPSIVLSSAAAANAVMLGAGYFSPLEGFHSRVEAVAIARGMRTPDGTFWPIPCLNLVPTADGLAAGQRITLRDPNLPGAPVIAVQRLESIDALTAAERAYLLERIFRTADPAHPGVATLLAQGDIVLGGPIEVLNFSYFEREFPDTFRTAMQIRAEIAARGWRGVVAFQTRNPMHRAHEELCRIARERTGADGILIHMLLGRLIAGDVPAAVRAAAIRRMVECYFEPGTVLIAGYGFDMLYAGPREAVLHAAMRQNAGCTDFVVGRDHAGVGSYYGPFDAQRIFHEDVPAEALAIRIFEADQTAYSRRLGRVVMKRDAPDHGPEDFVELSGTRVRELLAAGASLPPEFARPEVARILGDYYRSIASEDDP